MNFKGILSVVLMLSLTACTSTPDPKRPPKPKPDYDRAAVLNIQMGEGYLEQGQVARAKTKFVHALELKPKMPEAHSAIGYFYETVGDIEQAEFHHRKAIKYGDGKARYYSNYGAFLCRQARYKEADKAFTRALSDKQYVRAAEVYENAGLCMLLQKDITKAYSYLQAALMNDPKRPKTSLELADLEVQRRNYKAAEYNLNTYKEYGGEISPRYLWLSIQAARGLNKKDDLANAALQLKNLFPKSEQYKSYQELKD